MTDAEPAEDPLDLGAVLLELRHVAPARAAPDRVDHPMNVVRLSFDVELDRAVRGVPDPPLDPDLARRLAREPAEADPLDAAGGAEPDGASGSGGAAGHGAEDSASFSGGREGRNAILLYGITYGKFRA